MIRIFRNIIATILLVIIPISAIGLSITIHKCNHRGSFHIKLFDSSLINLQSDCCTDYDNFQKNDQIKTRGQLVSKIVHSDSNMMKMSEKNKLSCVYLGTQTTNDMSKKRSNESKYPNTSESVSQDYKAPCCSNLEFSNDFSIHLYTIKIINDKFKSPVFSFNNFLLLNLDLNKQKLNIKDSQCLPIRPIISIISFIKHSTSLSVDEAEPVSLLL